MDDDARLAYRPAEAAAVAGVSESVLKRAIAAGSLVARYPTSHPVVERTELHAWLRSLPTSAPTRT